MSLFWVVGAQGLQMDIVHVFSVEKDPEKLKFICEEHPDVLHAFSDVQGFTDEHSFCHICGRDHAISKTNCSIDLLISGPSCKDLSKLNTARKEYSGCYTADYEGEEGTSGLTYKHGFKQVTFPIIYVYNFYQFGSVFVGAWFCVRNILSVILVFLLPILSVLLVFPAPPVPKVINLLSPRFAVYENVKSAAERSRDSSGVVHPPPVEARPQTEKHFVHPYCPCIYIYI